MAMKLKYDAQGDAPKRLMLETYGCQMNVADSEVVATVMKMAGYETCETIDEADAIFINTCSVRDNAEQRIFSRLNQLNALRHKRQRRLIIGIIGCMAERMQEVLINEHGVDLVAGPDAYLELPALIGLAEQGEKAINTTLSTTETYRDIIPSRVAGSKVSGFISIMRGCNNFCTYCIVPYTREWYLDRIARIRAAMPDCGISTDMFTGFHDETDDDFEQTLSLMREVGFDSAFMFKYSERPGTYASKHLPDNVPEAVKIDRLNRMIALQNELSLASNQRDVGKTFEVLVEGYSKRSRNDMFGRTPQNKVVVFPAGDIRVGDRVLCRVLSATSATLKGEVASQ